MLQKITHFASHETQLGQFIKTNKRVTFPLMILIMFAGLLTYLNQYQVSGIQTQAAPQSLSIAVIVLGNSSDYANAQRQLLDDPKSLKNFYQTSSYGNMTITGQVFGPYQYAGTPGETCHTLASKARSIAGSAGSGFDRVIIFSPRVGCLRQGTIITPSGIVIATGYNINNTGSHEIGHTLGLGHAGAYKPGCVVTQNNVQTLTSNCVVDYQYSYFDGADVMGTQQRLFHNRNKMLLGWLQPTQINNTGVHNLIASSESSGERMLVLGNSGLYLELRSGTGFDEGLSNNSIYIRRPCAQAGTEVSSCKITTLTPGSVFYDPFKQVWVKNMRVSGTTAEVYVGFGQNADPSNGDGDNSDNNDSVPVATISRSGPITFSSSPAVFTLRWSCSSGSAQLKTNNDSFVNVPISDSAFKSISETTTYTLKCTNGIRTHENSLTVVLPGNTGGEENPGGGTLSTQLQGRKSSLTPPAYSDGPLTLGSGSALQFKWTCPRGTHIKIENASGTTIHESTVLSSTAIKPLTNSGPTNSNRSYYLRCLRRNSDGTTTRLSSDGPLAVTVTP